MKNAVNEIIRDFKSQYNKNNLEGMARYGINTEKAFGVSMPYLRKMGKAIGKNSGLALELWNTGYHEARILATIIAEPGKVTLKQMEQWSSDFDSWDVCDQCCNNLFVDTPYAYKKAVQWSKQKKEFKKRAGFVLMAVLAVHSKELDYNAFISMLEIIKREAGDERNFVKKAVNWALRQIGKRNADLHKAAIKTAEEILEMDSKAAKWIARDALKELNSENLRIRNKK